MLEIVGLSKSYGTKGRVTRAIDRIDFEVEEGEFVSVVGPSGCGKTTLLKCMAGLLDPTEGQTLLFGKPVHDCPPEMAVVFQDYSRSLFAWMSVRRNVALPLRKKAGSKGDHAKLVDETLEAVGLGGFADHYPWQLSGGMQQRVAIARALAYQPKVLLMDEPFASVDAQTRGDLEDLVLRVRRDFGVTCLLITHDIDESVYMSDRVVVLSTPPSHVAEIVTVDLPRPRDQVSTREHPNFAHLRGHVYQTIKGGSPPVAAASAGGELTGS